MNRTRLFALAAALILTAGITAAVTIPARAGAPYSCTTSATLGSCGPYDNPAAQLGTSQTDYVVQDEWNAGSSEGTVSSQLLQANSSSDWAVTASMTGNGAVLTGPEAQVTPQDWTGTQNLPVPVADYTAITSSYAAALPASPGPSDDYEAAYDIWLGDDTQTQWTADQEIMIWTDNHGQQPAGTDTGKTWTDASTGTAYEIWVAGGRSTTLGPDGIVTFAATANQPSGSVDLLALFRFLQAGGYSSGPMGIDQVNFGFELCSTSGQPETFTVSGFTISAAGDGLNGAPGGSAPGPSPSTTSPAPSPSTTSPAPSPSPSRACHRKHRPC